MCGAYGFSIKDARELYNRFNIENTLEDFQPCFNIRPGQMNPVITSHSPNHISRMFWGLIPFWAKAEKMKFSTINARAETVATSPAYRKPFRTQRCLIPATGFYEPDKIDKKSPPYDWFYFVTDQELFAFAGLYDIWKDKNSGKEIYSYTILTTEPNELVGKIHNRMPVILSKEDEADWVNPDIIEPEHIFPMIQHYPADKMKMWHVNDEARNPRNDYPTLIEPLSG